MLNVKTGIITVETPYGKLCVYGNDKPIADALQTYGEWAGIEIEFLQQFVPERGSIVDAGCHVGAHSAAFAEGRPGLVIHAFEPQPSLQELASCNFEAVHRCGNAKIQLHPFALGSIPGHGYMPSLDFSSPVNAGASQLSRTPRKDDILVSIASLDAIQLPPISFIKLDLEGNEGAALEGAHELIRRDFPVLYCEINHADGVVSIFHALRGFGYRAYFVETAAFNPQNYRGESNNLFGYARESGLLLLPPSAPVPERRRAAVLAPVSDLDTTIRLLHATARCVDTPPLMIVI